MTIRRNRVCCRFIAIITCVMVVLPSRTTNGMETGAAAARQAASKSRMPIVVDVELGSRGDLTGIVVDADGQRQAGVLVEVEQNGEKVAAVTTDEDGEFVVGQLRGRTYQLLILDSKLVCRAWQHNTAPPSAQPRLLLVASNRVTRGQREFGSKFHSDKLLIALILAGAVAIPIVVGLQSSDDVQPAS